MNLETFFNQFELLADAPNGVQKLRELILQLAVMGKLVPQDENDEPASVLLEKIKAEKDKLVKEKKIKKSKPLPPITDDEIPYDLPIGWEWSRLEVVGEINPRNKCKDDLDVAFTPMSLIPQVYKENVTFERKKWKEIKKGFTHFAENDVVIAKITPCFQNGKGVVMRGLINKFGAGTTELYVFRGIDSFINPDYVLLYLKSPNFVNNGILQLTGTAGQKRLPKTYFSQNPFPLPPLNEQYRIVKKVDQLMKHCDELELKKTQQKHQLILLGETATHKLINTQEDEFKNNWGQIQDNFELIYSTPENIKQLRQTILQLAVMGKLVPQDENDEPASILLEKIKAEKDKLVKEKKIKKSKPLPPITDDEIPYNLPIGWEWVRFSNIANIASNLVKPQDYLDSPHVAPDNIEKQTGKLLPYRTIQEDNVKSNKHKFFSGQIIYSKIRPNLAKVILVDFEGLCSADMYPIDSYIYSKYLLIYMLSITFLSMSVKKDTRVAMPKINQEELNKIIIPLPPLNEQHRIVKKVDQLMNYCDELEQQLTKGIEDKEKLIKTAIYQLLAS